MASVLLWIGIIVTVIGWIGLGWEASRRMAFKNELEKFQNSPHPGLRDEIVLTRGRFVTSPTPG